jgi:hypothetical protein
VWACLEAADGRWLEAEGCFDEMMGLATELGRPLEVARTQAAWGVAAVRYGPWPQRGRSLLSQARRVFAEHGAKAELGVLEGKFVNTDTRREHG